jgi:hypothetical protein
VGCAKIALAGAGGERFLSTLVEPDCPSALLAHAPTRHGGRPIPRRNASQSHHNTDTIATIAADATTIPATRADHSRPQPSRVASSRDSRKRRAGTAGTAGDRGTAQQERWEIAHGGGSSSSSSIKAAPEQQPLRRNSHLLVANTCEGPSALLKWAANSTPVA